MFALSAAPLKAIVSAAVPPLTGMKLTISVQVELHQPEGHLVVAHGCLKQLDVPPYSTYELFKVKLEKSLLEGAHVFTRL